MSLFDKGKMWELALPLAKKLCEYYETVKCDYRKLADVLVTQPPSIVFSELLIAVLLKPSGIPIPAVSQDCR